MMRYSLILAALLLPSDSCAAQEAEPAIQEQLTKVAAALPSAGPRNLNVAAIQQLKSLNESVTDKGEIVKQVAIFAAGPDEQQPLVALAIMDLLELPPAIVIRTLAPYLDADDAKMRSFVRDWFQSHDNGGPDDDPLKAVNFEDYVKYVHGQKGEAPAAFVKYVYERSPGRALLVYRRAMRLAEAPAAKGADEIALAEQIVGHAIALEKLGDGRALPEAKEQLAKLAKSKEWWVRLYVAEIMRRHRELRLDDVLQKLRDDSNESVSKAAKAAG